VLQEDTGQLEEVVSMRNKTKRLTKREMLLVLSGSRRRRDQALAALMWKTGCKTKDILALRREDIEVDAAHVLVSFIEWRAGFDRRDFPQWLVDYLDKQVTGLLFPMTRVRVYQILYSMGYTTLGHGISSHSLLLPRHEKKALQRKAAIIKRNRRSDKSGKEAIQLAFN
jgi:integrase